MLKSYKVKILCADIVTHKEKLSFYLLVESTEPINNKPFSIETYFYFDSGKTRAQEILSHLFEVTSTNSLVSLRLKTFHLTLDWMAMYGRYGKLNDGHTHTDWSGMEKVYLGGKECISKT